MRVEKILLTDEENGASLDIYVADPIKEFTRKALLILPGGAYVYRSPRETEPVAQAFMPYGYNAFVLHYTVGDDSGKVFPAQLIEVATAIKHIKDHAEEYGIDPEELFVAGFSAGGHLAGLAATRWKMEEVYKAVADLPYGYNKPKGVMMIYPAVNSRCSNCERYSQAFGTLFGCKEPSDEQLDSVSIDFYVDADSVPVFVMHTFNDKVVDVRNVMLLGTAYANAGIPFEMHVYPDGPHGLSVANAITAWGRPRYINSRVAEWVRLAAEWAETL